MTDERYTVWELARMGECAQPDSEDSVGGKWLRTVEGMAANDIMEELDGIDPYDLLDVITNVADSTVPVWSTHQLWQIFVDLCAYETDLYGSATERTNMTDRASLALFLIANRLITELVTPSGQKP